MSQLTSFTQAFGPTGFQFLMIHEAGKTLVQLDVMQVQESNDLLPSLIGAICKFSRENLQGIGLLETTTQKVAFKRYEYLIFALVTSSDQEDKKIRQVLDQIVSALQLKSEEKWGAVVKENPKNMALALQTWSPAFLMDIFRGAYLSIYVSSKLAEIGETIEEEELENQELVLFFEGVSAGYTLEEGI